MSSQALRIVVASAIAACVLTLALLTTPSEGRAAGESPGTIVVQSEPPISFFGGFSPKELSTTKQSPVSLTLDAEVARPLDGSAPPAVSELVVQLDRQVTADLSDIPTCPIGLQIEITPGYERNCAESIIGSGHIEVLVSFPEQEPKDLSGEIRLLHGSGGRGPERLWAIAYFPAPISGSFHIPIGLKRRHEGRFEDSLHIRIPKIANGAGVLLSLSLTTDLRHRDADGGQPIFAGRCDHGRLQARFSGTFITGQTTASEIVRACTSARPAVADVRGER